MCNDTIIDVDGVASTFGVLGMYVRTYVNRLERESKKVNYKFYSLCFRISTKVAILCCIYYW